MPILFYYCLLGQHELNGDFVITSLFVSNFIGIAFARTLHYQFYSWYFHMLPYLLWRNTNGYLSGLLGSLIKVCVLVAIEVAFNVFPATPWSSLMLQVYSNLEAIVEVLTSEYF